MKINIRDLVFFFLFFYLVFFLFAGVTFSHFFWQQSQILIGHQLCARYLWGWNRKIKEDPMCLVASAAITKYHKVSDLNNRYLYIFCLIVLETRRLKIGVGRVASSWQFVLCLCPSFGEFFWQYLVFLSLWVHHPNLHLHVHVMFFLCMSLCPYFPLL